ncbi:unnamed protein product [Caenorhabditis auriculariae]|uniref:Uncharacterized protein n=1 Tax=Caenorhabditis auriculariae TaxID=2777116 RepID=A0A8S1HH24_9PELO|nr:unnamed protein product [Caenorhabditis auriculariae]
MSKTFLRALLCISFIGFVSAEHVWQPNQLPLERLVAQIRAEHTRDEQVSPLSQRNPHRSDENWKLMLFNKGRDVADLVRTTVVESPRISGFEHVTYKLSSTSVLAEISLTQKAMSLNTPDSRMIFFLGLSVLFGWMIVILICASPHLFRNYFKKWFKTDGDNVAEKIRKAEARLEETLRLAQKPSTFLVDQAALLSNIREAQVSLPLTLITQEEEEEEEGIIQAEQCLPSASAQFV